MADPAEPEIAFAVAADGAHLAYASSGQGFPIVRAAHYLSHLQFDSDSPVWKHWIRELSRYNRYVRYDERGCGLSDWDPPGFGFEEWVSDLETVVDTLALPRFDLLGVSQGGPVGIAYAVRHPERVRRLILYGTYALGWHKRPSAEGSGQREAMHVLIETGWGKENPAFRQLFTSQFIPDAGPEPMHWFNELQRVSCPPKNAARFDDVFAQIDVAPLLPRLKVPTIVLHARGDEVVPFEQGRFLAARIPGARFVPLEGRNHILLEHEPGWRTFLAEVRAAGDGASEPSQGPSASPAPPGAELGELAAVVRQFPETPLSRYVVVGHYLRFRPADRQRLKGWKQRVVEGLGAERPQSHLLWAPPGSGKTFLVREIAASAGGATAYQELNLADVNEEEFAARLRDAGRSGHPELWLIDEVDAKPNAAWPFERLLPALEDRGGRAPRTFVLAGSSTSSLPEFRERLAARPKGPDLLSRIPPGHELVVPALGVEDAVLLTLSQVRESGRKAGLDIRECERMALLYVASRPELRNARQLRNFVEGALGRLPRGEDTLRYDHLFAPGDPRNKEFWSLLGPERAGLADEFLTIAD